MVEDLSKLLYIPSLESNYCCYRTRSSFIIYTKMLLDPILEPVQFILHRHSHWLWDSF